MKKFTVIVSISMFFGSALMVFGQTNFYENVSSLWFSGQKADVLRIAEQRLQSNTNDIAGLILKMEYEIAFLDLARVTNTIERVLQVGKTITTTNFIVVFPKVQEDINHLKTIIPSYPPEELAADQGKGNIAGKSLPHSEVLKALQKDGYFDGGNANLGR